MMENKLPCCVVTDLLPMYLEDLTSEDTKKLIDEHLEHCPSCNKMREELQSFNAEPVDMEESVEIDFLKKTRKGYQQRTGLAVVAVLVICCIMFLAKTYLIGSPVSPEFVSEKIEVNDGQLKVHTSSPSQNLQIKDIHFTEEGNTVKISYTGVRTFTPARDHEETYTMKDHVDKIMAGEQILWYKGNPVSDLANAIYASGHNYIGDPSANAVTMNALGAYDELGAYDNQLQTATEPYGWKIEVKNPIPEDQILRKTDLMRSYAYVMIGVIQNLGEVQFEYSNGSSLTTLTVTEADATEYFGKDIKLLKNNIDEIQNLILMTGLK